MIIKTSEKSERAHNSIDIIGQRFGKLVVVSVGEKKKTKDKKGCINTNQLWNCLCDCGKSCSYSTGKLRFGSVTHCPECPPINANPETGFNRVLLYYKKGAKERNLLFNLSKESFKTLIKGNCHYCGQPPSNVHTFCSIPYVYNGVDRIDNSLGYEDSNCVSCCKPCNVAKMDRSYNDFIAWIRRVHTHLFGGKNVG